MTDGSGLSITVYWLVSADGYSILVITSYWSLQHIGHYSILVITSYWSLQHIGHYIISVITEYWSLQHIGQYLAAHQLLCSMLVILQHIGYFAACWLLCSILVCPSPQRIRRCSGTGYRSRLVTLQQAGYLQNLDYFAAYWLFCSILVTFQHIGKYFAAYWLLFSILVSIWHHIGYFAAYWLVFGTISVRLSLQHIRHCSKLVIAAGWLLRRHDFYGI